MTRSHFDEISCVLPPHSTVTAAGTLAIGGCEIGDVADRFGTPSYVIDAEGMRDRMHRLRALLTAERANSEVVFASKALPVGAVYAMAAQEGLSIDVAGPGELALALRAGVDPRRLYLHGNARSTEEIESAVRTGVGTIVIDGPDDIVRLDRILDRPQDVLIRVIPGIDADTHPAVATGGRMSKFGMRPDQAHELIARLSRHPWLRVRGVHVHVGSQITDLTAFQAAMSAVGALGEFERYDIGGGLGVAYTPLDDVPTIEEYVTAVGAAARRHLPDGARLIIEPGRSLVARYGVTIYRANAKKHTGATFLAVDGGLADQMNVALTGRRFTATVANRVSLPRTETLQLVGRQCESGDLLVDEASLPEVRVGDLVVLAATGAYGFTLANNYNGALIPPVVFCERGVASAVVRRQDMAQLIEAHRF